MEQLGQSVKSVDIIQLRKQRDILQGEKAKLATELQRIQNLLKI